MAASSSKNFKNSAACRFERWITREGIRLPAWIRIGLQGRGAHQKGRTREGHRLQGRVLEHLWLVVLPGLEARQVIIRIPVWGGGLDLLFVRRHRCKPAKSRMGFSPFPPVVAPKFSFASTALPQRHLCGVLKSGVFHRTRKTPVLFWAGLDGPTGGSTSS